MRMSPRLERRPRGNGTRRTMSPTPMPSTVRWVMGRIGDSLLAHRPSDFRARKADVALRRMLALEALEIAPHPALDATAPAVQLIEGRRDLRRDPVRLLAAEQHARDVTLVDVYVREAWRSR